MLSRVTGRGRTVRTRWKTWRDSTGRIPGRQAERSEEAKSKMRIHPRTYVPHFSAYSAIGIGEMVNIRYPIFDIQHSISVVPPEGDGAWRVELQGPELPKVHTSIIAPGAPSVVEPVVIA